MASNQVTPAHRLAGSGPLFDVPSRATRGDRSPARGVTLKPALIRTYVPVAVGALITLLAGWNIQVGADARTALVAGGTGVATAAYYTIVHVLETRWPFFSVLLGSTAVPSYTAPNETATTDPATATQDAPINQG